MPVELTAAEAERFLEYLGTADFEREERGYKVALHRVLERLLAPQNIERQEFPNQLARFFNGQPVLQELGFSTSEAAELESAVQGFGSLRNAFANLCGGRWGINNFVWIPGAIAGGLGREIANVFAGLVDDATPLHDRVDGFRAGLRVIEKRFEGAPGSQPRWHVIDIHLNFVAALLGAMDPQRYSFYLATPLRAAFVRYGLDWPKGTAGERYQAICDVVSELADELRGHGAQVRDLIDVQSYLFLTGQEEAGSDGARVWLVRAGRNGEAEAVALDQSVAVIGWSELPDLSDYAQFTDLKALYTQRNPDDSQPTVSRQASQIHRFAFEIRVGDLIVLPLLTSRGTVAVGRVLGGYEYHPEPPFLEVDAVHTRPVEWLAVDVPYEAFDADIRGRFGLTGTVAQLHLPDVARRVLEALAGEGRRGESVPVQSWWVNQGKSYERSRQGGYLWAPVEGASGRVPSHWASMTRVKPGDLVMHYSQGYLRAVGRVTREAVEADRPTRHDVQWEERGRVVQVAYFELDPTIALETIPVEWRQREKGPFARTGQVNQGYLYPLSFEFADELAKRFPQVQSAVDEAISHRREARRWYVYVPRVAAGNLQIGRQAGFWGVHKEGRLAGLQAGDEVVLVHDLASDGTPRPSSFPRVALEDFHGLASLVLRVRLTGDPVVDQTHIWPDAPYADRFPFEEVEAAENVLMNSDTYPPEVLDAIRRSALDGGCPVAVSDLVIAVDPTPSYEEPSFEDIAAAIRAVGMRITDDILRRYHLSLKTRGFVILSGVSGSGKTWLADAYAEAIGARHLLTPVAPNWTANEDLLGYFNPLTDQYVDTPFSTFLREAAAEYEQAMLRGRTPFPYHLVLDEMNLARVEYYFAKFLSVMEVRARDEEAYLELSPGELVRLAPNVSFVGTVNVDETTHGFADKVYDRAQLIEVTVEEADLVAHLGNVVYAQDIIAVWRAVGDLAPFAYRVLDEIKAYVAHADTLGVGWETALDEQLLQKVLPKLKGANPKTEPVLGALIGLCDRFPLTHAKATRMLEDYRQYGFTSYF